MVRTALHDVSPKDAPTALAAAIRAVIMILIISFVLLLITLSCLKSGAKVQKAGDMCKFRKNCLKFLQVF